MEIISDSQLVSAYQNGCEDALSHLIQRHQSDLFSFIYYKVQSEDLANDLFQDTFVKIIITLKERRYTEEGKFIVWAKRIAHNLVIDHFRAKGKYQKISETTFEDEEFSIFDLIREPSESVEDRLFSEQVNKDLHKMLEHLPENQREVIQLRFFEGFSFKEIAEKTDTSINTTLGRVRYALINLRKIRDDYQIFLTKI